VLLDEWNQVSCIHDEQNWPKHWALWNTTYQLNNGRSGHTTTDILGAAGQVWLEPLIWYMYPLKCPYPSGNPGVWFIGPTWVCTPQGILIGSQSLQTHPDRLHHIICSNSTHSMWCRSCPSNALSYYGTTEFVGLLLSVIIIIAMPTLWVQPRFSWVFRVS